MAGKGSTLAQVKRSPVPSNSPVPVPSGTLGSTAKGAKREASEARRAALLRCAREEIARNGIYAASLNEVARRAGGSKATITKLFGNKAGLFAAVVEQAMEEALQGFSLEATVGAGGSLDKSLEESLVRVSTSLLSFYLQPEALAVYRAAVGFGKSSRELTRTFYVSGHLGVVRKVAGVLRGFEHRGLRSGLDFEAEAGRLSHLIRSGLHERALLGLLAKKPSRCEIEQAARESVLLFLHGVAATPR